MILLYPTLSTATQVALFVSAIPYFVLYTYDLHRCGYHAFEVFRVYALNLLLVPVNLGGVLKSLQQAVSGRKIPFGRTPKSSGRTATPKLYLIAECTLLLYVSASLGLSFADYQWINAAFNNTTATR